LDLFIKKAGNKSHVALELGCHYSVVLVYCSSGQSTCFLLCNIVMLFIRYSVMTIRDTLWVCVCVCVCVWV